MTPVSLTPEQPSLMRMIRKIEDRLRRLETRRSLPNSSIGEGGLRSSNFDGTLDPATAGTAGWGLSGTNGNAIFNDVVLRGGIIGNDALTAPVKPAGVYDQISNFAYTTTATDRLVTAVLVPAGFTSALVSVVATAQAVNSGAAASSVNVGIFVDQDIVDVGGYVPTGGTVAGSATSAYATTLTDLGASFAIRTFCYGYPAALGGASARNSVAMSASVLFMR